MKNFDERVKRLSEIFSEGNAVFFGGAGVSTESGVPDFRSSGGIFAKKYDYPPEQILSHSFFRSHTDVFYDFYKKAGLSFSGCQSWEASSILSARYLSKDLRHFSPRFQAVFRYRFP